MGYGALMTHLNAIADYLSEASLLSDRNYAAVREFQRLSIINDGNYSHYWASFYSNNFYDFQLIDGSLLYFGLPNRHGEYSYSYLGAPRKYISYDTFLSEFELSDSVENEHIELYNEFLAEQGPVLTPSFFRYDFSPRGYKPGLHPISHIHVGFEQSNRIGVAFKLTPYSFIAFILRQQYPETWASVFASPEKHVTLASFKNNLDKVPLSAQDISGDMYLF